MKLNLSLALIVVVGLVASSSALPARKRMVYYQQPAQYYSATPQRLMYMQYVQPSSQARSHQAAAALVSGDTVATSTYLKDGEISAIAGPSVNIATDQEDDVFSAAGAHGAHSVAEAYPEEDVSQQVDISVSLNDDTAVPVAPAVPGVTTTTVEHETTYVKTDEDAKVPRDYNFDAAEVAAGNVEIRGGAGGISTFGAAGDAAGSFGSVDTVKTVSVQTSGAFDAAEAEPAVAEPASPASIDVSVSLPAPAPIAPVATPAKRYLPSKKKVYVELEHSAEADEAADTESGNAVALPQEDDDEEEEEETDLVPVPPKTPARRPAAKKPVKPSKATPCSGGCSKAKQPLPAGTFFPIDFGGTAGGAIAIANSFSTGEGGSATSHAIAYGTPEASRARVNRPNKYHRRV